MAVNPYHIACLADELVGVGPQHDRPRYLEITESRESKPGFYYGWCGDGATYLAMLAGCSSGQILNRARLNNGKWTPGDNLTRLTRWAKSANAWLSQKDATNQILESGWFYIRERPNGDHIGIVMERTSTGIVKSIDFNSYNNVVARNHWKEASNIRGYIKTSLLPTTADVAKFSEVRQNMARLGDEAASFASLPSASSSGGGDGVELSSEHLS